MRREVKTPGYGAVTASMMFSLATALKADKRPWVQAYCYLAGRSRRGDTLDEWGALHLDRWLDDYADMEPRNVSVAQVGWAELTRELFGGQRTVTHRAITDLIDLGLIQVIAKGNRGNVSLYFMGFIDLGPEVHKKGDFVHLANVDNHKADCPQASGNRYTFSGFEVHVFRNEVHKRHRATCGNDAYSIGYSIDYSILRAKPKLSGCGKQHITRGVEGGRVA